MIHCNSNIFYILRGGNDSTSWSTVGSGSWPLEINLTNNNAQFGGIVTAITDMRTPIYYDSQNTAFFIDPNSTSTLLRLGIRTQFENPGSMNNDWDGGFYHFAPGQNTPTGQWGHAIINRLSDLWNVQMFFPTSNTNEPMWIRRRQNGTYSAWRRMLQEDEWIGSKYLSSDGAIYGTIFYDSNDGSRYLDPNGTSQLVGTTIITRNGNSNDTFGGLEIRENNLQGAATGAATEAPGINFHWSFRTAARLYMNSGGNFVLGGQSDLTNNRRDLAVAALTATGNITAYSSDTRLKINVAPIDNALNKVMSIGGYTFDWVDEIENLGFKPDLKTNDAGVLAQEIQAVLPQAVAPAPFDWQWDGEKEEYASKSGENYLTVRYERLVPLLIEAIKELKAELDELKAR